MRTQMRSGLESWRARAPVVTAFLAVALVAPSWAGLTLEYETPAERVEVPNIEGSDLLTGEAVSLAELKGHVVVVDIALGANRLEDGGDMCGRKLCQFAA